MKEQFLLFHIKKQFVVFPINQLLLFLLKEQFVLFPIKEQFAFSHKGTVRVGSHKSVTFVSHKGSVREVSHKGTVRFVSHKGTVRVVFLTEQFMLFPLHDQFVLFSLQDQFVLFHLQDYFVLFPLEDQFMLFSLQDQFVLYPLQEQFVFALVAANYLMPDDEYSISSEGRLTSCRSNITGESPIDLIHNTIQRESSRLLCYFTLAKNVPALISTLLVCSYTDIAGRKLGLLLPCIGGALKGILYVVVIYCKAPVSYLFIGVAIEGLGGSHMTIQSSAYAYLADILDHDQRSLRFAAVQAVLFFATAVGNVAIGYMITWGYVHSFW